MLISLLIVVTFAGDGRQVRRADNAEYIYHKID